MFGNNFPYTPLEVGHIRLLSLQQDRSQDHCTIEGDLYDYQLNSVPPYEAVSYAWGDMHHTRDIVLQGLRFPVGENLYNALSRLRKSQTNRILWVDAICVNQNDPDEISTQVARMPAIYTRAERVLIWLGEATEAADKALEKLMQFEETGESQIDPTIEFSEVTGRYDRIILDEGFRDISSRPWFRLLWPLHDMFYAGAVVLYCGSKAVSSKALVRASLLWRDQPGGLSDLLQLLPRSRRDDGMVPEYQFSELLQRLRYVRAENPRDKIHVFFSLLNQGKSMMRFVADYSMSEKDLVRAVIATLCFCEQDNVPETTYDTVDELLLNLDPIDSDILEKIFESSQLLNLATLLRQGSHYIRVDSSLVEAASRNKTNGNEMVKLLHKAIDRKRLTSPTPSEATSLFSDVSAPLAITSHPPEDISISVSHVVEILLSQATFSDLCQTGFHPKKLRRATLALYLPGMLEGFGRRLLREAQFTSARHTAQLICRDSRLIAVQIRIRYGPSYVYIDPEMTDSSSDSVTETERRPRKMRHIPRLMADTDSSSDSVTETERRPRKMRHIPRLMADTDSDSEDDQATGPREKEAKLVSLDEMSYFITSSQAFETLLEDLKSFVKPSRLHNVSPSITVPGPTKLHSLSQTSMSLESDEPAASIMQKSSGEKSYTIIPDIDLPNDSFWTWVYERLSRLLTSTDTPKAGLYRIQYTCVRSP